ncbi:MAG TPA: TonB-dependent receptor [Chthoniobacterales bacterium]
MVRQLLYCAAVGTLIGNSLHAQVSAITSNPPGASPPSTNPNDLSSITVQGVAPSETVVPRSASSVFGTDLPIVDTPRSVTELSPELLRDADLRSIQDFDKLAPSTYTTDQFGGANVPTIRGQPAEVFQNGIQRTTRSDGQPLSLNGVESIDVVAGPPSSVYGPTANTGGYINFVTKRPYFDGFHGSSSFTTGYYDTYRWQEDVGGPIIPNKLAFRLSYEGEYSNSYYRFQHTQSNDVYLALNYIASDKLRFDFNTEFFVVDYNENTGWNRPTQDLIDNGQYLTGEPVGGPQFFGVIDPTGKVKLDRSIGLVAPSDRDFGKNFDVQFDTTYDANENLTIVNKFYFEYYQQRQIEYAQRYYNLISPSNILQDRLEAHINFSVPVGFGGAPESTNSGDGKTGKNAVEPSREPASIQNSIITGIAFRYVNITAYADYYNEYLNGTDLTENPSLYPITTNLFGVVPVPGTNQFATPAVAYNSLYPNAQPTTLRETGIEASVFYQHEITFNPQWRLLYGARLDTYIDEVSDPVAPPGYAPAKDSTSQLLGSVNASVTYKPVTWATTYGTFSFNESTEGNNGGGFAHLNSVGNGIGLLSSYNYHYTNYLYEAGLKFNLLKNQLFVSLAGYHQEHNLTNTFGAVTEVRTNGAELVATYQPNRNFYVNFSGSYLDSILVDPGASEFTHNVYDAFAPPYGTGVGSPNFIPYPPGHYRQAGLPHWLVSAQARYKLNCGLGAVLSLVVTDPIPTSELQNVKIPWQYEVDAAVFYEYKNFEARLNLFNVTDQKLFSSGGSAAGTGNDLITPRLPFHIEGTITYKF